MKGVRVSRPTIRHHHFYRLLVLTAAHCSWLAAAVGAVWTSRHARVLYRFRLQLERTLHVFFSSRMFFLARRFMLVSVCTRLPT